MFSTFLQACLHAFHTFFRENTRRKQPATNLWTTRASQGKKTLTNPYDRSLIALS